MKEKNYLFSAPTLILLSIGMIALFGFAFLAFEGGRIYVERQQLRSYAAEAASEMCAKNQTDFERVSFVQNAALAENITINHPPTSGSFAGNENYIEVAVSGFIGGGLVDLASAGAVEVTGQAVVYCEAAASKTSVADISK
jgi:Flp pilus assembly protein TadG